VRTRVHVISFGNHRGRVNRWSEFAELELKLISAAQVVSHACTLSQHQPLDNRDNLASAKFQSCRAFDRAKKSLALIKAECDLHFRTKPTRALDLLPDRLPRFYLDRRNLILETLQSVLISRIGAGVLRTYRASRKYR